MIDYVLGSAGSGIGSEAGCCVHGNEQSGSVEGGVFRDQLGECQLVKKDFASKSYLRNTQLKCIKYIANNLEIYLVTLFTSRYINYKICVFSNPGTLK